MAHQSHVRMVPKADVLPRGLVVAGLALLSWGLVVAAWQTISLSLRLLLGT
jgi:hypothetical protein